MTAPPVRTTTIRTFLKGETGMRVSEDAVDCLVGLLTTATQNMALSAAETAQNEARSTIMARDIQEAFKTFLEASGPSLIDPKTLHTAITGISNQDLTNLIKNLRDSVVAKS